MADRNTPQTSTFEEWRQEFNELATDVGDLSNLGSNAVVNPPTDIVEACNNAPSQGFTIAMVAALG